MLRAMVRGGCGGENARDKVPKCIQIIDKRDKSKETYWRLRAGAGFSKGRHPNGQVTSKWTSDVFIADRKVLFESGSRQLVISTHIYLLGSRLFAVYSFR